MAKAEKLYQLVKRLTQRLKGSKTSRKVISPFKKESKGLKSFLALLENGASDENLLKDVWSSRLMALARVVAGVALIITAVSELGVCIG